MSSEHTLRQKRRVCIVYGGRSGEHEVSIRSAISVSSALDRRRYEVGTIAITKAGEWVPGVTPLDFCATEPPVATAEAIGFLGKFDLIFPVLHGPYGEDGTIQGLFEMLDLPYVGAGVLGSALAMDKAVAKLLFAYHGLPVVPHLEVSRREWRADGMAVVNRVIEQIGFPCFTKPANLGSSVGISKVHDADELRRGLDAAAEHDRKLLVEKAINAREIECSVLGNDAPQASVCGEIVPCRGWYDYEAKYIDERSELLIPAPIEPEQQAAIQQLAVEAFRSLDCSGMARADFFLCRDTGAIYLNELNTIPGFTTISMYPKLWEASGLPYPELLDQLIELGFERYADRAVGTRARIGEER
ncbi:MAG: D-alanine--D-alanine ligase [Verrucomicrobia bacterium]|nr:D-alanine--D-alanine ligase [Verrucomicrobiota bacterium]